MFWVQGLQCRFYVGLGQYRGPCCHRNPTIYRGLGFSVEGLGFRVEPHYEDPCCDP